MIRKSPQGTVERLRFLKNVLKNRSLPPRLRIGNQNVVAPQEIRNQSVLCVIDPNWMQLIRIERIWSATIHNEPPQTRPAAPMYDAFSRSVLHQGFEPPTFNLQWNISLNRICVMQPRGSSLHSILNRRHSIRSETYCWTAYVWSQPNHTRVDLNLGGQLPQHLESGRA